MIWGLLAACHVPAPQPPRWGDARVAVSGPDAVDVDALPGGVVCDPSGVSVRAVDGPYWGLTITPDPPTVWWARRGDRADAVRPGPTWVARSPAGLDWGDEGVALHGVEVTGDVGTLTLDAQITCPVAGAPVPDEAVAALSDVAGAPAERVGVRARVRVPLERVGAVVDGVRGRLRGGVLAWAGAHDDDGGEVWLGRGSGPLDVVRHAGVDGLEAPHIGVVLARLAEERGLDLVVADATTVVARVPAGADPAALAREVAALCPAVLDAGDASLEALATQIARDHQVVCWWD
ncbi:MAG: DUF4253 domain-containing protein [Myxococcota bacterium]